MATLIRYFRRRPWLLVFLAVVALGLWALRASGNLHLQGNGRVTVYEWACVAATVLVWLVARLGCKTDLIEEYVMGWIFAAQWEFLTEPYWRYIPDKFNVVAWRDIPILALVGWGPTFALTLLLTNWLGRRLFRLDPRQLMFDWRVLALDVLAIQLIGSSAEWLLGVHFHCWDYTMPFGIGRSPLGLGWEVHIGYAIVFFWYGTTMRVWKYKMEGAL
jgi:hypothetical protein